MSKAHNALNRRQWEAIRFRALSRANWRCRQCGRAGRLEVHHVVPLEHGGAPYAMENLRVLCRSCHIEVHDTADDETKAWRRMVKEL